MITLAYPDFFPCATWEYGEAMSAHQRRTAFESGWVRQRNRWPGFSTTINLSFTMDSDLFERWSTWMNNNGYDWFHIPLDRFNGTQDRVILRLIAPYSWGYASHDVINVSAVAELQDG